MPTPKSRAAAFVRQQAMRNSGRNPTREQDRLVKMRQPAVSGNAQATTDASAALRKRLRRMAADMREFKRVKSKANPIPVKVK